MRYRRNSFFSIGAEKIVPEKEKKINEASVSTVLESQINKNLDKFKLKKKEPIDELIKAKRRQSLLHQSSQVLGEI